MNTLLSMQARTAPIDLSAFGIRCQQPFLCDIQVQDAQMGTVIEHVSNVEYVRWLDRGAELHADSLGYTRAWLLEHDMMWFVARHEIDYHAEVWRSDELVLATWVRDFKRVKSWREYVILRPADHTVVCHAVTLWVLVNLTTRKPMRIPLGMISRFGCEDA
jgi:acyl-CoA thioester hydrolase